MTPKNNQPNIEQGNSFHMDEAPLLIPCCPTHFFPESDGFYFDLQTRTLTRRIKDEK